MSRQISAVHVGSFRMFVTLFGLYVIMYIYICMYIHILGCALLFVTADVITQLYMGYFILQL